MTKMPPKLRVSKRFVVVGGAGAMGRITVKDLVETCFPDEEIVIADYDEEKARAIAALHNGGGLRAKGRVQTIQVDVKNHEATGRALKGAFVVINAAQYQLNLDVME